MLFPIELFGLRDCRLFCIGFLGDAVEWVRRQVLRLLGSVVSGARGKGMKGGMMFYGEGRLALTLAMAFS